MQILKRKISLIHMQLEHLLFVFDLKIYSKMRLCVIIKKTQSLLQLLGGLRAMNGLENVKYYFQALRITWPLDGDAGLVFRSAHFAKYFTILSVKFEPLCIRPIMSAKADKGDRKREIEQSPMKKKFRDSAISSEDLDSAIASRIELAFKEHQSTLNSVVNSAVRDAMDSVLIPALRELREDILATNKSVRELREEFEAIVTKTKQTRDRVDSVQAAAREDKRTVTDLKDQLERLTEKMTDMEDRCRRNNVRLVGLPEGMEGPDAAVFLRANLSKWIPSLRGRDIEIDRAHRVYDGGRGSDRPRTLIFRVLRWHDRSDILKGARQAYPVKCAQNNVTLLFFPDFSPATAIRRKAFGPGFEEDDCTWSPALPHLSSGD